MELKPALLQREFGIKAGLDRRSWRPTQKMKPGTSASEMVRSAMFEAFIRLDTLAVTALYSQSCQSSHTVNREGTNLRKYVGEES